MEEKINSRLLLIGISSMLLTWICTMIIINQYYNNRIKNGIRTVSKVAVEVYEEYDDVQKYSKLSFDNFNVMIVDKNGKIIFENSENKKSENILLNSEIQKTLNEGNYEVVKISQKLGCKSFYYVSKLDDNSVLCVSKDVENAYSVFNQPVQIFIAIGLAIVLISLFVSKKLTKNITKPIEEMGKNIDELDKNVPYKELKPLANAVSQFRNKKRENEKIRQEFTANVSHELKTPLTSILGYAEMIGNGMAKEDDVKEFADKIHTEAQRLLNLIGDIIKLSELDEPINSEHNFETVDLYEISIEIKELLDFNARQNDIKITVEGENPCNVFANKMMINELVYNLCDNAIKYNKNGGEVKISLSKDMDAKKVKICVEDTGIGIPEKYKVRIFERFYRVDKSRSKETGGTGLGLAIVKHVAIHHDAKISVFSEINKGTKVEVIFNA